MLKLRRKRNLKQIAWICFALLATLAAIWLYLAMSREVKIPKAEVSKVISIKPVSVESRVLFTGNSFWGRYTNDAAKKSDEPYKFPFARLNEFQRDKYDAWVTGLECPTTQKGISMTSADMEAELSFNCDPNYLPEFAKWFDVVSLANNHTDNRGVDGFTETQDSLAKNKIQYFGHYDPDELNDICEVVSLPARVKYDNNTTKEGKIAVALCGYHGVFKIPSEAAISKISEYAKYFPVIAMPHAGAEYKPGPDQIKTDMYRGMIDAGADMVIGDHPHWTQNTEVYKGKLIAYSMGNFMFDQQFNTEVTRSAAFSVDMTSRSLKSDTLEKWTKLAEGCESYHDTCLAKAGELGLDKVQFDYKFDVVATNNKGYQTHPAPELQAATEQRLDWQKTIQTLAGE